MLAERLRLRDIRNTSTFRLTVLFGLVFVASVAILLGVIYALSARELTIRNDGILHAEIAMLEDMPPATLRERIGSEIAHSASGLNYFELRSAGGAHIIGNIHLAAVPPSGRATELSGLPGIDRPIRLLAVLTPSGQTLLVGRDISPVLDMRRRVLEILLCSGLAAAMIVLGSGIALSLPPLRRVRDLQAASRTIAAGNLNARMPLAGRGDELDLFAGTVNSMIEEVERVVAQVKGVTDAVAHDLRTPLTRVRSQLYRLCQTPEPDRSVVSVVQSALGDLDIVLDRFAALLRISELETRGRHAGFRAIDIPHLIESVRDLYEPLADERMIRVSTNCVDCSPVHGDDKLMFEALSNLVDNAIKFTPEGGQIWLSATCSVDGPVITVSDNGPGIAKDERDAVLQRFYRGHGASGMAGTGLGLSVVAAIVHLHGLTLEFEDGAPGLIARIQPRIA